MTDRVLRRCGWRVSRLGLGGWAFGGSWAMGWGPQDDCESVRTVRHASRSGLNWIDVAPVYGLGHAEEVVGRALRDVPEDERPLVFTKCGLVWGADAHGPGAGRVARPDSLARELAASIRRLGVERLDLYQVHMPARDGTPLEEYWSYLAAMRERGLVKMIGLSNHSVAELRRAHAIAHVDVCQPPLSVLRRDAADVIAWCAKHEVDVITYSPLESGLLTGAFHAERIKALSTDDWRANDPRFSASRLRAVAPVTSALAAVAGRHRTCVSAVALAWALAWPGVTGVIVGARNPAQIDTWRSADELILTSEELDAVEQAVRSSRAAVGPVHPLADSASAEATQGTNARSTQ